MDIRKISVRISGHIESNAPLAVFNGCGRGQPKNGDPGVAGFKWNGFPSRSTTDRFVALGVFPETLHMPDHP